MAFAGLALVSFDNGVFPGRCTRPLALFFFDGVHTMALASDPVDSLPGP